MHLGCRNSVVVLFLCRNSVFLWVAHGLGLSPSLPACFMLVFVVLPLEVLLTASYAGRSAHSWLHDTWSLLRSLGVQALSWRIFSSFLKPLCKQYTLFEHVQQFLISRGKESLALLCTDCIPEGMVLINTTGFTSWLCAINFWNGHLWFTPQLPTLSFYLGLV